MAASGGSRGNYKARGKGKAGSGMTETADPDQGRDLSRQETNIGVNMSPHNISVLNRYSLFFRQRDNMPDTGRLKVLKKNTKKSIECYTPDMPAMEL